MNSLFWTSDLHWAHAGIDAQDKFLKELSDIPNDSCLVIRGDINSANNLIGTLNLFSDRRFLYDNNFPVYFVLGNHDFYGSSFSNVDAQVNLWGASKNCIRASDEVNSWSVDRNFIHLGHQEIIELTPSTALVGHRGWCDGTSGAGVKTKVHLNDELYIGDLVQVNINRAPRSKLFSKLKSLATEASDYFKTILPEALEKYDTVYLVTHVPPYVEASLYENKPSSPEFSPWFSCPIVGETLTKIMLDYPTKNLVVLCGHTHHVAEYSPLPNIKVHVAHAEYGKPEIKKVFEL